MPQHLLRNQDLYVVQGYQGFGQYENSALASLSLLDHSKPYLFVMKVSWQVIISVVQ